VFGIHTLRVLAPAALAEENTFVGKMRVAHFSHKSILFLARLRRAPGARNRGS
jgi:hypothetical protein